MCEGKEESQGTDRQELFYTVTELRYLEGHLK